MALSRNFLQKPTLTFEMLFIRFTDNNYRSLSVSLNSFESEDRPKRLKEVIPDLYLAAMEIWDKYISEFGREPTKRYTAEALEKHYNNVWKATSIERVLVDRELSVRYQEYKKGK